MAGPLSSTRPGQGAYTTRSQGTWGEIQKDSIGVYRGKSLTRDEGQAQAGGHVGIKTPGSRAMGQPPAGISNLHGKSSFKKRMRK